MNEEAGRPRVTPPATGGHRPARAWPRWLLVALWLGLIFAFSAQQGSDSSELSLRVVDLAEQFIRRLIGAFDPSVFHFLVRKTAHVLEYLVLGALLAWAWRAWPARAGTSSSGLARLVRERPSLCAFLAVVACAAADEFHQLFVPGRGPAVTDVLIDSIGAALGVALVALGARCTRRRAPTR